ncbi:hypothetical protein LINPERHAP1_LOCUS22378 [Linum perenne]
MSRTDWLVPIDSFHPHEQNPSFNFTIGSLVRENRRKNPIGEIRVHPIGKNANSVPCPTLLQIGPEATGVLFPSDSSPGTDCQVTRLGL